MAMYFWCDNDMFENDKFKSDKQWRNLGAGGQGGPPNDATLELEAKGAGGSWSALRIWSRNVQLVVWA